MTFNQLLRILWARKSWIAATVALFGVLASIALVLVPKKYTATASIVVNSRSDDPLRASQSVAPTLATQIDIIKRPRVARRVVSDLQLDADPAAREAWQQATGGAGDFPMWLAGGLLGGVSVAPATSDSSVIDVQYTSKDPVYSAKMANAFAAAFVATTIEMRTTPARQYVTFFDERLAELRKRLEDAQAKLSGFEQRTGLVNAAGKSDVENARLNELSTQLAMAQGQLADASSRQGGLRGNASASPEVMQNPVIQQLKGQLASQQVKVKELSLRLGPNHPEFIRARAEQGELQARLNAETGQVAASLGTAGRVSAQRVAELRSALDTQRERVLALGQQRNQADVLEKDVESARRAYDAVLQRQSQTMLESQAQQGDVSLLDRATTPARYSWPNTPLVLAAALAAGALLGALLALGKEYFSPLVRSTQDLVYYTGLPVLAVIPSGRLPGPRRWALPGPRSDVRAVSY